MKKFQRTLLGLSVKFGNKYASVDASTIKNDIEKAIQGDIAAASSYPNTGIMPFLKMLEQDQATLDINVVRNGNTISVSAPLITPAYTAIRYSALPGQIKNYLEKNLELFPTMRNNDDVEYNNLVIALNYPSNDQGGVATR
jgi:hypothetical protein